jgi:TBC1 domain family member 8/9
LSGASNLIIENPGYYQKLLISKMQIESAATIQIDKDLDRTFATEKFFINTKNVKKLRNVLVAYSFRNETIGYCQGMNFIVARLLGLGYNEEVREYVGKFLDFSSNDGEIYAV